MAKVVLHVCCGPCASACVPALRDLGNEVVLFYSNSNIDTEAEFEKRLEGARKLASRQCGTRRTRLAATRTTPSASPCTSRSPSARKRMKNER